MSVIVGDKVEWVDRIHIRTGVVIKVKGRWALISVDWHINDKVLVLIKHLKLIKGD